jgi:mRNA interferase MazF
MKQGDVYCYTFRGPDRRRPVLLPTRDSPIRFLTGITIAPSTSTIRDIPSEGALSPADGCGQTAVRHGRHAAVARRDRVLARCPIRRASMFNAAKSLTLARSAARGAR